MRRFAAIFQRDKDKEPTKTSESRKGLKRSKTHSSVPAITTTYPTLSTHPSTPQLTPSDNARSSGSSSSTPSVLHTPDDEPGLMRGSTKSKGSLFSWLGTTKKSGSTRTLHRDSVWDSPPAEWKQAATAKPSIHPTIPMVLVDDVEDDTSSELFEPEATPRARVEITPESVARARKNLHSSITNTLGHSPASMPPLLHTPGVALFPRSCSTSGLHLRPCVSLFQMVSRRLLVERLATGRLSPNEEHEIVNLGSRSHSQSADLRTPSTDEVRPKLEFVGSYSHGLKRWASRTFFEDRIVVYLASEEGTISCQAVSGTSLGVAELEFSPLTEALAGMNLEAAELEAEAGLDPAPLASATASDADDSQLSVARNAPYRATPSPLRMQHGPPTIPLAPSLGLLSKVAAPPTITLTSTVKQGVRFAENDKEDQIPLGYVLRMKKRREEKARFLREEQERRMQSVETEQIELERRKRDEERQQREIERIEWERERQVWEAEKRAMEEERRKRAYAVEVSASRERRESSRSGRPSSPTRRDAERPTSVQKRFSRPAYDPPTPRRQASEPAVPTVQAGSGSSNSPGSSRPPSIAAPTDKRRGSYNSQAPSINSSSSEDIRQHGKRGSMASISSQRPTSYVLYPAPQIPVFGVIDSPLLPPTPPFMMQQYSRSRSSQSITSPGSPGHSRPPSNSSSEQLTHYSSSQRQSPSTSSRHGSSSASPHRTHQRRPSDDRKSPSGLGRVDNRGSVVKSDPKEERQRRTSTYSRGRPQQSSSNSHPPSPWTGVAAPHDMQTRPTQQRRQTIIS